MCDAVQGREMLDRDWLRSVAEGLDHIDQKLGFHPLTDHAIDAILLAMGVPGRIGVLTDRV